MTCCAKGCKCKLSIVGLVLSSLTMFLQTVCIYLDKYEEKFDVTWFPMVTLIANLVLAAIHATQIGLSRGHKNEDDDEGDVESEPACKIRILEPTATTLESSK